jgi:hypothetical protein
MIKSRLSTVKHHTRRAVPTFRAASEAANVPPGIIRDMEVEWTNVED